ncbi:hypothetical protein SUGI_0246650 [Cryptomeria japonica]|nr:hypothetical protein SUGI_0246650 [Cryptomeria japonica]
MLEGIPMEMRADAVNRDPVYGCAGIVWNLHKQLTKLQAEKAILQAQLNGATTGAFIANENNKEELLKPMSETRDPL